MVKTFTPEMGIFLLFLIVTWALNAITVYFDKIAFRIRVGFLNLRKVWKRIIVGWARIRNRFFWDSLNLSKGSLVLAAFDDIFSYVTSYRAVYEYCNYMIRLRIWHYFFLPWIVIKYKFIHLHLVLKYYLVASLIDSSSGRHIKYTYFSGKDPLQIELELFSISHSN